MNNIIFLMEYKMLSGIKGDININYTSIYIIVECTLHHTHCTLVVGASARDLVFTCPALCKEKL